MKFEELSLCEPLLQSLKTAGYEDATQIQEKAIPEVLQGRDLVGCAQTGTGKTAAFSLPTLQRLLLTGETTKQEHKSKGRKGKRPVRPIRGLILSPTRELARQICDSLITYGRHTRLRHTVIYGGVKQGPQVRVLQSGVDILVATPGRLLDLVGQGFVDLSAIEILILDEADQMLDMGFIHDLRKIVAQVPARRQTLMFSATMPKEIRDLASQWLHRPVEVHVAPVASTPQRVSQAVYFVDRNRKAATLTWFLLDRERSRTLVFSRTKRGADKIARCLQKDGIRAMAIHGDKSQAKRQAVIREFNSKRPPVLVATDLAARGLDFSDVSHVINYDMPEVPETYVHRIGRTARAGAFGQAVSFCDRDERHRLHRIEKLTGQAVPVEKLPPGQKNLQPRAIEAKTGNNGSGETTQGSPKKARPYKGSKSKHPSKRRARPAREVAAGKASGKRRRRFGRSSSNKKRGAPRVGSGS